jgi:hypothetical protein
VVTGEKNLKKALVINNIASTKFANVRAAYLPPGPYTTSSEMAILKYRSMQTSISLLPSFVTILSSAWPHNLLFYCGHSQEKVISKTKLDIFENAFRKIKEATGVSDVNEVIQKIVNQEGTTENLLVLTKENQVRRSYES